MSTFLTINAHARYAVYAYSRSIDDNTLDLDIYNAKGRP